MGGWQSELLEISCVIDSDCEKQESSGIKKDWQGMNNLKPVSQKLY